MRFWVWGFCTSIRGGRSGAGLGHPRGSELCPGLPQATRGFSVRAQEPGTPLRSLQAPGQALPWAGTAKGCPGPRGGSEQLPHGPACHTRTLPSAIGAALPSGDNHLLPPAPPPLVAFTISTPEASPPPPSPALHPRSPKASFTLTEPPAPFSMSSLAATRPSLWTRLARGGGVPAPRVWLLVQLEGAALLPAMVWPASEPGCCCVPPSVPPGLSLLPPCTITCGLSPPECWHRAGAPNVSSGGGSWLTLPSHRAQGSGCGAALPSPPFPWAEPPLGADHGF